MNKPNANTLYVMSHPGDAYWLQSEHLKYANHACLSKAYDISAISPSAIVRNLDIWEVKEVDGEATFISRVMQFGKWS